MANRFSFFFLSFFISLNVVLISSLTKKQAAFFVPSLCHFVQLCDKCWAIRAKNQNHCAKSCQIFGTLCPMSYKQRHELTSSCSCQFLLNFWHFVQNVMPAKAEPLSSTLKSVQIVLIIIS